MVPHFADLLETIRADSYHPEVLPERLCSGTASDEDVVKHNRLGEEFQRSLIKGTANSSLTGGDIRCLRQFMLLGKRLDNLVPSSSSSAVWETFKNDQKDLSLWKVPKSSYLRAARLIVHELLGRVDPTRIVPRHGNGAVATRQDRIDRYTFDSWPLAAWKMYPFSVYGTTSADFGGIPSPPHRTPATRVALVPKDYKGKRLISIESPATQWLQQGQMRLLYRVIRKKMGKYVRLEDQTFNHTLLSENFSTIDLSRASDRIPAVLIAYLFPRVWVKALFSTRSQFASHAGDTVRLYCMSPMGSANCFPVLTIVLYSLILAVMRHSQRGGTFRVYGDDCIVPNNLFEHVTTLLCSCGLIVNVDKTCDSRLTKYRESCGKDVFGDIDVSIYSPRTLPDGSGYPKLEFLQWCVHQREFYTRGWYTAAAYCGVQAQRLYADVPVLTKPMDGALLGEEVVVKDHLLRWRRDYQRLEISLLGIKKYLSKERVFTNRTIARLVGDPILRTPIRLTRVRKGWHQMP